MNEYTHYDTSALKVIRDERGHLSSEPSELTRVVSIKMPMCKRRFRVLIGF